MPIAKGEIVRMIQPVIEGEVIGAQLNQDTLQIEYLVEWTDAEGDIVNRYFTEAQLEVVGE